MNIQTLKLFKTIDGERKHVGTYFFEPDEGNIKIFETAVRGNLEISDRRKRPHTGNIKYDSFEVVKMDSV